MTDTLHQQPPQPENPDHQPRPDDEFMHDAAVHVERVILGDVGVDGSNKPTTITTDLERRLIREGADDAVHKDMSIEHAEDLSQESRFDKLTEMATKIVLDEDILHALSLAQRENQGVALVEVDVGGVKATNDTHGLPIGDKLIAAAGRGVQSRKRRGDWVYRRGAEGDEFWVLVPVAHVDEESFPDFNNAMTKGLSREVNAEIDRVPELANSKWRNIMGATIGVGWMSYRNPRYAHMDPQEIAEELFQKASDARNAHKESQKDARNAKLLEDGKELHEDERFH